MKRICLSYFFASLFFFFAPSLVWAGCPQTGLVPCGTSDCPCTLCDFFVMFDRIVDFILFKIVPPLAALMIAIGGFMYIFAYTGGGGPEMISRAKRLFSSVVIGLLIVYGAWLIVNTFFMAIGVAEWTGLREGWWEIDCEAQRVQSFPQPSPAPSPSPSPPSTTTVKTGEIKTVSHRRVGNKVKIYVTVKNKSYIPRWYSLVVKDADGAVVYDGRHNKTYVFTPDEESTIDIPGGVDRDSLKGRYTVILYDEVTQKEIDSIERNAP